MDIKDFPKIDLHCHLDGSLSIEQVQEEMGRFGQEYTLQELSEKMVAPVLCDNLADYLARFEIPIQCVQTADGLETAAYNLVKEAHNENITYIETRFSPEFCSKRGLSYLESIEAVEKGLRRGREEFGIYTGIIICGMRHISAEKNVEAVKAAREMLKCGVVAVDLAGDEKAFSASTQKEMFEYAKKVDMPFTIHAGECGSVENVREAVMLGASRIGHGVAMAGNDEIINLCKNKHIGIEMCPISNLQTRAADDIHTYPIREFFDRNLLVSVNTDNRTVSNTSSTKEWNMLKNILDVNEEVLTAVYCNSVETAFADDSVKHELLKYVK